MASPTTAPPPVPTGAPGSRRWRPVLAVIVLAMVAMWGYVLYLAIGPGRSDPPDRLATPDFANAAQARCTQAVDAIAALPAAADVRSPEERAPLIDEANAQLAAMLDDLQGQTGLAPEGEDRDIVEEWLGDWRLFLRDRQDYADDLREGEDERLTVSAKGGKQVTDYIVQFAKDNDMPACSPPLDLGA